MTLHVIYSILWARIVNLYYFTSENSSLTTMVACAIYFISVSNICANVIWNLVMLKRFIWKLWFFSGDILSISINWLMLFFHLNFKSWYDPCSWPTWWGKAWLLLLHVIGPPLFPLPSSLSFWFLLYARICRFYLHSLNLFWMN